MQIFAGQNEIVLSQHLLSLRTKRVVSFVLLFLWLAGVGMSGIYLKLWQIELQPVKPLGQPD